MTDAALMARFKAVCKRLHLRPLGVIRFLIMEFIEADALDQWQEGKH